MCACYEMECLCLKKRLDCVSYFLFSPPTTPLRHAIMTNSQNNASARSWTQITHPLGLAAESNGGRWVFVRFGRAAYPCRRVHLNPLNETRIPIRLTDKNDTCFYLQHEASLQETTFIDDIRQGVFSGPRTCRVASSDIEKRNSQRKPDFLHRCTR